MGAGQSKTSEDGDKVFYSETPIQFSEEVVHQLTDHISTTEPTRERQTSIDSHVRSRIQAELARLREEEQLVKVEIEQALEKENLDKEREMAGEETGTAEGVTGSLKSSTSLLGDLEDVRQKVERFHKRKDLEESPLLREKGEAVVLCYQSNPTTPLDCWRAVGEFKAAVSKVEQNYVDSLR
ncbi:hypothetical protein NLI96_g11230 [Meripilus lineatus]|uniref:DUF1690-domain-containing protein n=1 Tax=Meripilus lineatus TaxID=2056292 RepID=A0AAD5US47_9APHY|nr:hypothetical protein NLI96_g11230 [Physisporinus lineatus]